MSDFSPSPDFEKGEDRNFIAPTNLPSPARPGGELQGKPIQGLDGQWYDKFGEAIGKDEVYSEQFWDHQPEGMREAMIENIESAAQKGSFSIFAGHNGIEDHDKEKMSAYRFLAKELGYVVGPFYYNKSTYVVNATITKI